MKVSMYRTRRARHAWSRITTLTLAVTTSALVLADPGAAFAATTSVVVAAKSLPAVIAGLQAWIMGILAAVATLYLVLAGVYYATAGGDPSQVEKAKSALKNALVGYGLAVLAPVLLSVVKGIVGG
jgi:Type IV secretion system pilin